MRILASRFFNHSEYFWKASELKEVNKPGLLPLANVRIVEISGLGPTPFGTMLLADLGAQVLRIERVEAENPLGGDQRFDFIYRGRPSVAIDLKSSEGADAVRKLSATADVLIEGFRPGTMERLGLGPEVLTVENKRLIYARMSGWGQDGPLANKAGHDINYLAMSGGLYPMGPHDSPPTPPLNLVGNFGGGGTFLAIGILAALHERGTSGRGQIIDVAMLDGITVLLTQLSGWSQMGRWRSERGGNLLDGSAYFYRCYETADRRHIAVGALEHQFHDAFIRALRLDPREFQDHLNPANWTERTEFIARIIARESLAFWKKVFEDVDACVSPVLSLREAVDHPANRARNLFAIDDEAWQPNPVPRFSRSPRRSYETSSSSSPEPVNFTDWGLSSEEVASLQLAGAYAGGGS